jgi:hypothetical protein
MERVMVAHVPALTEEDRCHSSNRSVQLIAQR